MTQSIEFIEINPIQHEGKFYKTPFMNGLYVKYTDDKAVTTIRRWHAPPVSLNNRPVEPIFEKHGNIKTPEQINFYIREYNEYMQLEKAHDRSRFNTETVDFGWYMDDIEHYIHQHIYDLMDSEHGKHAVSDRIADYIINDTGLHVGEVIKIASILKSDHTHYHIGYDGLDIYSPYNFALLALTSMQSQNKLITGVTRLLAHALNTYDAEAESVMDAQSEIMY